MAEAFGGGGSAALMQVNVPGDVRLLFSVMSICLELPVNCAILPMSL